jgi:hypothetical protein
MQVSNNMKRFLLLLIIASVQSTGHISSRHNSSREHLLDQIASSVALHIRGTPQEDFECPWRESAMRYAPKLQPWLNTTQQRQLFDALELATLCGQTFHPANASAAAAPAPAPPPAGPIFFVDARVGADANPGTKERPLATLAAAVAAARAAPGAATLLLRAGSFHLSETLELDARDSGLTIAAFEGERAVVSGGVVVSDLHWAPTGGGTFAATLSEATMKRLPRGVPALHHRGQRATLARFPNANAELDIFPDGYISDGTDWLPPEHDGQVCDPARQCGVSVNHTIATTDAWHGMFQNFTEGAGGACDRYDPPRSPWCSGDFYLLRQFPEMHTRSPSGLHATPHLPHAASYAPDSRVGAKVHAWRPGHWCGIA